MRYSENLTWLNPEDVCPGEDVLVHVYWAPNTKEAEAAFMFPPTPPKDMIYGEWLVSPFWPGYEDHISRMDRMAQATALLFQEVEGMLMVVDTRGQEWAIPHQLGNVVAKSNVEVPNIARPS